MESAIVLIIMAAYFGMLMLISSRVGISTGNDAFFTGNRKAPWYVVSIGMIGSSISGLSVISVPGMVAGNGFLYLQTVLGFFFGYIILAKVLLPVYYKLESPSIYTYLNERFGRSAYKTGAWFFLLSKSVGASAKVYVVVLVLHEFLLKGLGVSFGITATLVILLVWLYTFRNGTKTIIWTDLIQTLFMVAAMIMILWLFSSELHLNLKGIYTTVRDSNHAQLIEWNDWSSKQHFVKQFLSGIFIVLVMTGLDQEMIQKNKTIRKLENAQRNMYWYGFMFLPINLILLVTGVLMYSYASAKGLSLPDSPDSVLPVLVTRHMDSMFATLLLVMGIVSATFSGADSSMTSITTSLCVDILEKENDVRLRRNLHILVAIIFVLFIMLFRAFNSMTLIDAIYTIASYTYGPLLGLFAFGLLTRKKTKDAIIPYIAIASPVLCYALQLLTTELFGYSFGYELLMLNGLFTFTGLWIFSTRN
jgi:Na+/proline symporter